MQPYPLASHRSGNFFDIYFFYKHITLPEVYFNLRLYVTTGEAFDMCLHRKCTEADTRIVRDLNDRERLSNELV